MTDFQLLAKGIALAGCAIGAGAALIAGIGPGIGKGTGSNRTPARVQGRCNQYNVTWLCDRRDYWYLRFRYRSAADLRSTWYFHELPVLIFTETLTVSKSAYNM